MRWTLVTTAAFTVLFGISACAKKFSRFTSDKTVVKIPEKINFTNLSSKALSYEWDFGDGDISYDKNPIHQFTKSGLHKVVLKANFGKKTLESSTIIEVKHPDKCLIRIDTKFGSMLVQLYDDTPLHRDNFSKLVEEGYFEDLLFHRVIGGFMIQGGDPDSRTASPGSPLGSGGPGYTIPAEFNKNFIHKKGALAAARTGDSVNPEKKSSGSQFYIVQGNIQSESTLSRIEDQKGIKYSDVQRKIYFENGGTPFLDMEYTVFGEVIDGLEVIDKIAAVQTAQGDRPIEDVKMKIRFLH